MKFDTSQGSMLNFLGVPAADAGMAVEAAPRNPHYEAMAKSRGFNSYEEMIAFERNRQARTGQPQQGGTIREAVGHAMDWHPKVMFEKLSNIFQRINER